VTQFRFNYLSGILIQFSPPISGYLYGCLSQIRTEIPNWKLTAFGSGRIKNWEIQSRDKRLDDNISK
jgi:hypothetical protein